MSGRGKLAKTGREATAAWCVDGLWRECSHMTRDLQMSYFCQSCYTDWAKGELKHSGFPVEMKQRHRLWGREDRSRGNDCPGVELRREREREQMSNGQGGKCK